MARSLSDEAIHLVLATAGYQGFQPPLPYWRVMISIRCPFFSLK
jgi:hypothetical protein